MLFRIFNYPASEQDTWGVGEHTDYGLLTILKQDDAGGLEVKSGSNSINAPPVPHSFVCNIGDMLDRMTSGVYRSTPHRVRNMSGRDRLSFPFFFDPNFDAIVETVPLENAPIGHIPKSMIEINDGIARASTNFEVPMVSTCSTRSRKSSRNFEETFGFDKRLTTCPSGHLGVEIDRVEQPTLFLHQTSCLKRRNSNACQEESNEE